MKWHVENVRSAVAHAKRSLESLGGEAQERFASLLTALSGVLAACEVVLAGFSSEETGEGEGDMQIPPRP